MGEYILYHAKIWTAEKEAEWADAMWVSGDKILAVGAYQDMEDVASAHVRRIDMNGQMIIPYQIGSLAKGKKADFRIRTVRQEAGSQSDIPHHRLFRTHRYSRIQWDRS